MQNARSTLGYGSSKYRGRADAVHVHADGGGLTAMLRFLPDLAPAPEIEASQALSYLRNVGLAQTGGEQKSEETEGVMHRRRVVAIYPC
jgi:hypothetical protein